MDIIQILIRVFRRMYLNAEYQYHFDQKWSSDMRNR